MFHLYTLRNHLDKHNSFDYLQPIELMWISGSIKKAYSFKTLY